MQKIYLVVKTDWRYADTTNIPVLSFESIDNAKKFVETANNFLNYIKSQAKYDNDICLNFEAIDALMRVSILKMPDLKFREEILNGSCDPLNLKYCFYEIELK